MLFNENPTTHPNIMRNDPPYSVARLTINDSLYDDTIGYRYSGVDGYKYVYMIILRVGHEPRPLTSRLFQKILERVYHILNESKNENYVLESYCIPHIIGVDDDKLNILIKLVRRIFQREWTKTNTKNILTRLLAWKRYLKAKKVAQKWMERSLRPVDGKLFQYYEKRFYQNTKRI